MSNVEDGPVSKIGTLPWKEKASFENKIKLDPSPNKSILDVSKNDLGFLTLPKYMFDKFPNLTVWIYGGSSVWNL